MIDSIVKYSNLSFNLVEWDSNLVNVIVFENHPQIIHALFRKYGDLILSAVYASTNPRNRELILEGKNINRMAEQYDQYPSMLAGDFHSFFRLEDRRSFRNDTTSNRRRAEKFASNFIVVV